MKETGINVPTVYEIGIEEATIVMDFITGTKLKIMMEQISDAKKERYFRGLGKLIAILHLSGHIHGDITTSNIIITPTEKIFLIDFGLHDYSDSIEDKSVDLHLLKRVLLSSHGKDYELCYPAFLKGYKAEYDTSELAEVYRSIFSTIGIIESRGRYVKKTERR